MIAMVRGIGPRFRDGNYHPLDPAIKLAVGCDPYGHSVRPSDILWHVHFGAPRMDAHLSGR
jgi:hypothetical protein